MKHLYFVITIYFGFIQLASSQSHFEQGLFERDITFTKRVSRDFRPTIYDGTVKLSGYNNLSPLGIDLSSAPVETIQSMAVFLKMKTFTIDGDIIPDLIKKEFTLRLINRDHRVIAVTKEQFDLSVLEYYGGQVLSFHFDVNWDLREVLSLEIRLEGTTIYQSHNQFRLSDGIGIVKPTFLLD